MLDEQKQDSMVVGRKCKALEGNLEKTPKEETQHAITILGTTSRKDLISLGVTNRNAVLEAARKFFAKYNILKNVLARVNRINKDNKGLIRFSNLCSRGYFLNFGVLMAS